MKELNLKILFLFSLIIFQINCASDCSSCSISGKQCTNCGEGGTDCKWLKIDSGDPKCMDCTDISKGESQYYSRKYSIDNQPYCHKVGISGHSGAKLIDGTKQVVNKCKELGLYKLGDICYESCPDNSEPTSTSSDENQCQCKQLFYREIKDGFTYLNCLSESATSCPIGYNYIKDNECLKACPSDRGILEKKSTNSKDYYCISLCPNTKYQYSKKSPLGQTINYCLEGCPDEAKFYYDNAKICKEKCDDVKDYYEENYQCIGSATANVCDYSNEYQYYIIISPEDYIFKCIKSDIDTNPPCPNDYPYQFQRDSKMYCLKTCNDTQIPFFDNIKSYSYIENIDGGGTKKKCLVSTTGKYIIEKEKRLVDDCSLEIYWPFHEGQKCVSNCLGKFIDNDTNECLSNNCQNGYYKDEETNICFQKCPDYLGRGFHDENNKCVKCGNGEGFHKLDDDDTTCYHDKCPEEYRHNHLNNICFQGECTAHDYKYSAGDNSNSDICYYSCVDIGSDYKIEKEYKCYKSIPNDNSFQNYYYYETSYGINKYIKKEDAVKECFTNGLKYLSDNKCFADCISDDYKVYPTINTLGICFSSKTNCKSNEYIYYYTTPKICSKNCDFYVVKDASNQIVEINDENCFKECPTNYPYISGNQCVSKCSGFYKEENGIKTCVNTCDDYVINETGGHKKCVKYCIKGENEKGIPTFYNYYIDDDNLKICVDNCNVDGITNKFTISPINGPKECASSCPAKSPYYYADTKVCLKECDAYYDITTSEKLCVHSCTKDQYIHPGKKCTSTRCPGDTPFFYREDENSPKECVESCPEGYDYIIDDDDTNECVKEINGNKKILYGVLVDSCPLGFSVTEDNPQCGKPNDVELFIRTENGIQSISSEDCGNNKYISSIGECLEKCPISERYVNSQSSNCMDKCEDNNYYTILDNSGDYYTYKCLGSEPSSCPEGTSKYFYNEFECINSCGDFYEENNICYRDCSSFNNKYLMINDDNKIVCTACSYYDNTNNICEEECSFSLKNIIVKDSNECADECNNNNNKYLQMKNNQLYCSDECEDSSFNKHDQNKCKSKCESSEFFEKGTSNCISECSAEKKITVKDNEKICSNSCDIEGYPYSYKDSQNCLSNCNPGDYVIQGTSTCVQSCTADGQGNKYYFEYDSSLEEKAGSPKQNTCVSDCSTTNKPFTRKNDHCDTSCDTNPLGDYFTLPNSKNCLSKTDCNSKKINKNICIESCSSDSVNKYEGDNDICIPDCYYSNSKIYLYNSLCQDSYLDYILEKNVLKEACQSTYYYSDNQCVIQCPKGNNFFLSGATKIECLDNCPSPSDETPQYYYSKSTEKTNMLECKNSCKAYVIIDETKNLKLCLGDNCNPTYPYYILDSNDNNNEKKICYEKCPNGYNYYYEKDDSSGEFLCRKEDEHCPQNYILKENTKLCIKTSDCKPNYYDINEKKCIEKCPDNKVVYEDSQIRYCHNNCIISGVDKTLYLDLNKKQCLEETSLSENEKIINENEINFFDCEKLYYNDISSGIKVCIDKNEINCTKQIEYPYLIEGTNQCSHICTGILSLNGTVCYEGIDNPCPEYSHIEEINNNRRCKCDDKYYYYDTETSREIYCMPPNSKCPRNESINRELLIEETKECVEYCPFDKNMKKYGKTCIDLCPIMSVVVNDECFCQDKWYMDENDKMICVTKCPEKKPIMIAKTKECVETCINTEYPVYYRNNCYSDCSTFPNTNLVNNINADIEPTNFENYKLKESYGEFGNLICFCKGVWYEDINNGNGDCYEETKTTCDVLNGIFDYKYIVYPTKECVSSCPKYFKYSFNDQCFASCDEANALLNYVSEKQKLKEDSNTCICSNLWKYDDEDKSKILCLTGDVCPDEHLLIKETKECYKSTDCRPEYPLLFNGICYNQTNCPKNTKYKEEYPKTCSCVKYYYIENGKIICLSQNDNVCPDNYYLIKSQNKCSQDTTELSNYFEFNKEYYNFCPPNTIEKVGATSKICICDAYYYWYEDVDTHYLNCSLTDCFDEYPKKIIETKQCLKECPDGSGDSDELFEYKGICYYEGCPTLTQPLSDDPHKCELTPIYDESDNATLVTQIIKNNIVTLYSNSNEEEESNVIDLVKCDTTVEFYGVNKNKKNNKEKHNNKDKKTSSLSYIDLSECIQQIYETNHMGADADIIILKYDLQTTPNEYLINPVEYKFINSKNGHELDASACGNGGIKISYPFSNIISALDKLAKKKRNLVPAKIELTTDSDLSSLTEKYNVGKIINGEYSEIDTFNANDKIYTDFCTSIEINGKDLVLEDRMGYLLPHYSLCEQNCTYNRTDFEEERIYCACSFKTEFDLKREHQNDVELNENVVTLSQDGTTNFPVLKCISVLGDSKRIKNNIAFYYMLLIFIIEICFLVLNILFGYSSFRLYFNNKIIDNDITEENIEIEIANKQEKPNYDEVVKTTQRELNNPPIRNNNNIEEEEEEKEERNGIEFIPEEFVFLYFNDGDKGVKKQVEKTELPFDIKEKTKILLQKIENYDYANVNADGPFPEDQNIIEIIFKEEEKVKINIESINETITDNDNIIDEKNNKNKINDKELIPISEEKIYRRESIKNYMINDFGEIVEDKENKDNKGLLDEIKLEQRLLTRDYNFYSKKNDTKLFTLILILIHFNQN